jgi:hypothetical protein
MYYLSRTMMVAWLNSDGRHVFGVVVLKQQGGRPCFLNM